MCGNMGLGSSPSDWTHQTGEVSSSSLTRTHVAPAMGLAVGAQLNLTCNSHLSETDRCEFK